MAKHIESRCPKIQKGRTALNAKSKHKPLKRKVQKKRHNSIQRKGNPGKLRTNWPSMGSSGFIRFFEGGLPSLGRRR